nr:Asp23/Gls24 family envelope stress response protein [Actinomycetospora succinea]
MSSTPARAGGLDTEFGRTTIADPVVAKVAGLAAREIPGVHGFGGGASRAFGAITERLPGGRTSSSQGVSVEVGERQAAVDLIIVVEYGVAIADLSRAIRRNVIGAVEQMTGLQVVEVNVNVVDLHLPSDDDSDDDSQDQGPARSTNRVQ